MLHAPVREITKVGVLGNRQAQTGTGCSRYGINVIRKSPHCIAMAYDDVVISLCFDCLRGVTKQQPTVLHLQKFFLSTDSRKQESVPVFTLPVISDLKSKII